MPTLGSDVNNVKSPSDNQRFYDSIAHEYDRSYHSPSKYHDLHTAVETEFIISNMVPMGRTLEVGPGQGRFTQSLAENSTTVIAADLSIKMLEICKMRTKAKNVVYRQCDLFELKDNDFGGFDTIVVMWVIPHLDDATLALRKLSSLLRPEGRLIFDLWNSASLRSYQLTQHNKRLKQAERDCVADDNRGWAYTRYYTYDEMLLSLQRADLKVLSERGRCLLPTMVFPGRRLFFPLYRVLDALLQRPCKRHYYSRLFCCTPA